MQDLVRARREENAGKKKAKAVARNANKERANTNTTRSPASRDSTSRTNVNDIVLPGGSGTRSQGEQLDAVVKVLEYSRECAEVVESDFKVGCAEGIELSLTSTCLQAEANDVVDTGATRSLIEMRVIRGELCPRTRLVRS